MTYLAGFPLREGADGLPSFPNRFPSPITHPNPLLRRLSEDGNTLSSINSNQPRPPIRNQPPSRAPPPSCSPLIAKPRPPPSVLLPGHPHRHRHPGLKNPHALSLFSLPFPLFLFVPPPLYFFPSPRAISHIPAPHRDNNPTLPVPAIQLRRLGFPVLHQPPPRALGAVGGANIRPRWGVGGGGGGAGEEDLGDLGFQ